MLSTADTIVAVATPPGRGALGIVRLSGPQARPIASALLGTRVSLPPRQATFARIHLTAAFEGAPAARGGIRDQVIATFFPGPHSPTGEDVVELSAHGSPVVLRAIVHGSIKAGARLAEPGEFSLRGYLHGKIDLVQAEAVRDLVEAKTPLQAQTAFDQLEGGLTGDIRSIEAELFDLIARLEASLDFPDEGYHFVEAGQAHAAVRGVRARIRRRLADADRGRLIREGVRVAILGTPNVGKSSLFNRLLNADRAIISAVPGTTRDLLTEQVDLHGFLLTLVDTAGLRQTEDCVEQEGVTRARLAAGAADLCLVVLDRSRALESEDRELLRSAPEARRLVVVNKMDLRRAWTLEEEDLPGGGAAVEISASTGAGMDRLARTIVEHLDGRDTSSAAPGISNVRHITLLERADHALTRAEAGLSPCSDAVPEEFMLADLHDAAGHLQEVTGRRTTEDLLAHVFARFCVGK